MYERITVVRQKSFISEQYMMHDILSNVTEVLDLRLHSPVPVVLLQKLMLVEKAVTRH